jgi:hypothetical protein
MGLCVFCRLATAVAAKDVSRFSGRLAVLWLTKPTDEMNTLFPS